jgi:flagellar motility protein MotE (MotC chaperone)
MLTIRARGRLRIAALLATTISGWPVRAATSGPDSESEVRKYCTSLAATATEARFAWQTARINELEARLKAKIKELEAKEAQLHDWIEKRQAIEKKASEKLVGIYSKMRPETAATQLSALDDDMAAAVLAQLGPRQASAIFNEIVPERAAKLAGMIAGNLPADDKKP